MPDPFRQQLLGYLIGALEDSEKGAIERQLVGNPGLQEKLARARESLEPLESARRTYRPPTDLAARTCRLVALYGPPPGGPLAQTAVAHPGAAARRLGRMTASSSPPSSVAQWSWADLSVAAAILVVLSLLVFPAVTRNRDHARLVACQENLRQFGLSLAQLGQEHPEMVPMPPAREKPPAGTYRVVSVGHQGFNDVVWGQNVLLPDGRVAFVPMGPAYPLADGWFPAENPAPLIPTAAANLLPILVP
jgi:hypothetical protein